MVSYGLFSVVRLWSAPAKKHCQRQQRESVPQRDRTPKEMCGYYGGAQIVGRGTQFSPDGRFAITAGEKGIYVFSAVTSRKISEWTKDRIIKFVALSTEDSTQVCFATAEVLMIWDFMRKQIIASCNLAPDCVKMNDLVICKPGNAVMVSCQYKARPEEGKILRYLLPSLVLDSEFCLEQSFPCKLMMSPSGKTLCIFPDGTANSAVLHSFAQPSVPRHISFPEDIQCAALDAFDEQLAVGCRSGRILLYTDISMPQDASERLPSILHWHATSVAAVAFSSDAHHLFSTGEEGVLVSWKLSDMSMTFVPRLGLNVQGMDIHPSKQSLFLFSFEDNSFKIIDSANYKAPMAVHGISPLLKEYKKKNRIPYCEQPRTGYLALPASQCSVQFYDLFGDRHITTLQIVPRMATSKTKQKRETKHHSFEPFLQSMAFNRDGSVLVALTVRSRVTEDEVKTDIRFFDSDGPGKPFFLNTEVLDPHKGSIAAMCCSPVDDLVATTSRKGYFRIWVRQSSEQRSTWRCKSIGSYKGFPLEECCFSFDGSVLAIVTASGVGLWDPTTLTTLGHVAFPDIVPSLESVQLQFSRDSDFLIGCVPTESLLLVWDLQSLTVRWASRLSADCLTSDSTSSKFAVVLKSDVSDNELHEDASRFSVAVFDPVDSTPCAVYSNFRQRIRHLHFTSPDTALFQAGRHMENGIKHTHAPLLVLSASHQYSVETETGSLKRKSTEEFEEIDTMPSVFEMAFGSSSKREDRMEIDDQQVDADVQLDLSSWTKIPSHALPSVSVLCSNLLDQIIDKNART